MKITIILIAVVSILAGCTNKQEALQSQLNTAYHRGYCDGRLSEIEFYRTNAAPSTVTKPTHSP